MTCGVYKLTFSGSDNFYIGSSLNIEKRMRAHRSECRRQKHSNTRFQRCWNKYGEFQLNVLEVSDKGLVRDVEQKYIDLYLNDNNCLNLSRVAEHPGMVSQTEEARKKISENSTYRWTNDRESFMLGIRAYYATPESTEIKSKQMTEVWKRDNTTRVENIKKSLNTPEYLDYAKDKTTKLWQDPEYREKVINGMRKLRKWYHPEHGEVICSTDILCQKYNLRRPRMYDVVAGRRGSQKGWKFVEEVD